jgi:hypothetical protein
MTLLLVISTVAVTIKPNFKKNKELLVVNWMQNLPKRLTSPEDQRLNLLATEITLPPFMTSKESTLMLKMVLLLLVVNKKNSDLPIHPS